MPAMATSMWKLTVNKNLYKCNYQKEEERKQEKEKSKQSVQERLILYSIIKLTCKIPPPLLLLLLLLR